MRMLSALRVLLLAVGLAGAHAVAAPAAAETAVAPAAAGMLEPVRLAGGGSFRWFGLHIYDARLWVGPQGYNPAAPGAAPFVLELRYARNLSGSRIAEASAEQMAKTGAGSAVQREAWLQSMRALFPDVKEGDSIAGQFVPGQGARFQLNGAPLGVIEDAAFAQGFFGIWLSPRTTAPALREALLRQAGPRP